SQQPVVFFRASAERSCGLLFRSWRLSAIRLLRWRGVYAGALIEYAVDFLPVQPSHGAAGDSDANYQCRFNVFTKDRRETSPISECRVDCRGGAIARATP